MNNHMARYLFAALVTILVLVPVARNFAADPPPAPAPPGPSGQAASPAVAPPAQGTFPRPADPIVIKGEDSPKLLGATDGELRVFAERDGKLQPIPYQMDERNQWGEFVIVHGKRVVPDEDKGKFDENDEIVFLGRDIGGKVPKNAWPSGTKAAYAVEITDPLTGAKGYAYVASYASASSAPSPSPVRYMQYKDVGEGGLAIGQNYELGFLKSTSGLDYNHLVVKKAAGGDDVNHFDRLKVRVLLKLRRGYTLGISSEFNRNEKNFLVKYFGYKEGPVRDLRVMKNNLQLLWKLPSPGATVNSVFYPDWIEWPVPINLPVRPSWLFSRQELDVSHDFDYPPDKGVKLFVSTHPDRWFEITGKAQPDEMALNKETSEGGYYGIDATSIGAGGLFYTVRRPKSFDTKLGGVFRDDTENSGEPGFYKGDDNEPERGWTKGATPLAGGRFVEWGNVGRGIYTVYFYHFYPPNYKPGAEKPYMEILDHPVQVSLSE